MNILLVDDEKLAVEVVKKTIDMSRFGVDEVYTAYSMKQAIEVLEIHSVEIMVCDIEMPKGSGLDLAAWIREQGLDIMIIFLTSHALFQYAHTAIQLNAVSYLLKPVKREELAEAIRKAADNIQMKQQLKRNEKYMEHWKSNKVALQRDFWRACLQTDLGGVPNNIYGKAKKSGIPCSADVFYYPLVIVWSKDEEENECWDYETLSFAIENVFSEMLFRKTEISNLLSMYKNKCVIICSVGMDTYMLIREKCKLALEYCQTYLPGCNITVYVKEPVKLEQIGRSVKNMINETESDIVKKRGVVYLQEEKKLTSYEKPDMKSWVKKLLSGFTESALKDVEDYLNQLVRKREINASVLQRIQQDFLQDLYIEIGYQGIQANIIFSNDEIVNSFGEAGKSISGLLDWISCIGDFLSNYHHRISKVTGVVQEVKLYIEEHIREEINRSDLAAKVYLHPDYMNRLFKEQVGTSVSDYIIQMRLKHAQYLLRTTELSISAVAADVGYPNTSYFTKLFKRSTSLTPKDFRKTKKNGELI